MNDEELITKKSLPVLDNPKHKAFVKHYVKHCNASKAAISSGYAKERARQTGHELLNKSDISLHIQYYLQEKHRKLDISNDRILREVSGVAFARMSDLVENTGKEPDPEDFEDFEEYKEARRLYLASYAVKPLEDMGDSEAAIEFIEINRRGGIASVKTKNKMKALELLGKHKGLWDYEPETSGRNRESNLERIREAIRRSGEQRKRRDERKGEGGNTGNSQ